MSLNRPCENDALAIADDYHRIFITWWRSGVFCSNKKSAAALIVVTALFLFLIYHAILDIAGSGGRATWQPLAPLLLSELLALSIFDRLKRRRRRISVELVHAEILTDVTDTRSLKALWLNDRLSTSRSNYLTIARELEYIANRSRYGSVERQSVGAALIGLVFEPGAKARVNSLVIAIGAAIVALSIAGGATLSDFFEMFENESALRVFTSVVHVSITLFVVYAFAVLVLRGSFLGLKHFGYVLNPSYGVVNERRISELSVEMALLHRFRT